MLALGRVQISIWMLYKKTKFNKSLKKNDNSKFTKNKIFKNIKFHKTLIKIGNWKKLKLSKKLNYCNC